jgi:aspartate-semialdehyde dehydrogenase
MMGFKVAIVGASGLVGRVFLEILEKKNLPISSYTFFSSNKSAGRSFTFKNKECNFIELTENSFDKNFDFALFATNKTISQEYAQLALKNNCLVIDNSSAFRMDPDVPLVVPEVNPEDISNHRGLISNPNCSTIQAVIVISPLLRKYKVKRIVYSTYQAVSGAGRAGILDLKEGIDGRPPQKFLKPIANNCIPHIDDFLENRYTKEEEKMINETRKILHDTNLKITATAIRIPILNAHCESINIELGSPFVLDDIISILKNTKGVVVMDDPSCNLYPTPIDVSGKNDVFVGRIRRDYSVDNGLNLWVVADNLRRGSAYNAVGILEKVLENRN